MRFSFPLPPAPFGQYVHSPAFKFSGHEFRLKVFPHGNQAAAGEWISAYLEWTITQSPPPTARFTLSMEAANGTAMVSKIATHSFSPAKPLWGFRKLMHRGQLRGSCCVAVHLHSLTPMIQDASLDAEVTIAGLGGSSSSDCDGVASGQGGGEEGVLQPAVKRRRRTYELGTAAYFDSPTFSDCRVLLTDGTSLHGHRLALAQASPVFAAMWGGSTREALEQQVTIEADPAAATNLLRHMYGLAIMLPLRQVPELLLLADMYQVPSLVDSFSAWLATRQLNTDALAAIIPALRAASQQLLQQGGAQLGQGQQGQDQEQQGQGQGQQGQGQREREGVQAQLEDAPQLQQLLRAAAGRVKELMRCEHFLSGWCASDVQALLCACCSSNQAGAGVAAAHAWLQHAPEARQPHWGELLDGVDFGGMSAADMSVLRAEAPDVQLAVRMLDALLVRQLRPSGLAGGEAGRGGGGAGGRFGGAGGRGFGGWGGGGRGGAGAAGGGRIDPVVFLEVEDDLDDLDSDGIGDIMVESDEADEVEEGEQVEGMEGEEDSDIDSSSSDSGSGDGSDDD